MAKSLFSVPIFFIAFRECLEASLIIAILLGLVEQIVQQQQYTSVTTSDNITTVNEVDNIDSPPESAGNSGLANTNVLERNSEAEAEKPINQKILIRRLRIQVYTSHVQIWKYSCTIQIFLGAAIGLFIALAIGSAFIAVWFTQASNLWSNAEELWEGIFSLVAYAPSHSSFELVNNDNRSIIIMIMGLTMLKLDQAKTKWRVKLQHAFAKKAVDRDAGAKVSRIIHLHKESLS